MSIPSFEISGSSDTRSEKWLLALTLSSSATDINAEFTELTMSLIGLSYFLPILSDIIQIPESISLGPSSSLIGTP